MSSTIVHEEGLTPTEAANAELAEEKNPFLVALGERARAIRAC